MCVIIIRDPSGRGGFIRFNLIFYKKALKSQTLEFRYRKILGVGVVLPLTTVAFSKNDKKTKTKKAEI